MIFWLRREHHHLAKNKLAILNLERGKLSKMETDVCMKVRSLENCYKSLLIDQTYSENWNTPFIHEFFIAVLLFVFLLFILILDIHSALRIILVVVCPRTTVT